MIFNINIIRIILWLIISIPTCFWLVYTGQGLWYIYTGEKHIFLIRLTILMIHLLLWNYLEYMNII